MECWGNDGRGSAQYSLQSVSARAYSAAMRLLHTSDWHIGRTFHGHSTDEHLAIVLAAIADAVVEHEVDAVIVAGDIFDSSTPKADAFTMLNEAVGTIRDHGAAVILSSGNHDGPARLGHMAAFAAHGGVHLLTELARLANPVMLHDAVGPVALYGIPYVHPSFLRAAFDDFDGSTQQQALTFAMGLINTDIEARRAADSALRCVVVSHCFTTNVAATVEDTGAAEERDITRGGLDLVAASTFDGADYVALGHIHSRSTLSNRVRYSGAPLRFSFGQSDVPRGAWIVDLDAGGLKAVEWLDLPVPREVSRLFGTIEELLAEGAYDDARENWVDITLTDDSMPVDAMRRCQAKFPYAVTLQHRPANAAPRSDATYTERVAGKSDTEITAEFLAFVRNGEGPTGPESELLADTLQALAAAEATR